MAVPPAPGRDSIAAIAAHYRTAYGVEGQVRTDEVLRANGHDVNIKPLRAERGGLEACVVPLSDGTYRFVCDDRAAPGEPDDVADVGNPRQFRISFRLAHELAHTALRCMSFGTRRGSHSSSAIEARCDAFAVLFLVERDEALVAVTEGEGAVQGLARRLNIPPSVVRAAASATG
jgi:hypothetical protein